jgi:hypothetical protein
VTEARELRVARNHAIFREVNERIFSLSEEFGSHPADDGVGLAFVCECGDGHCATQLVVDTEVYSRVRANPGHFLVAGGHELPANHERIVERNGDYIVVERLGALT